MNSFIMLILFISSCAFIFNILWYIYLAFNFNIKQEKYCTQQRSFNTMLLLIPAMNEYKTLVKHMSNLLNLQKKCQNFFNLKLAFIDDDSNDGTTKYLQKFIQYNGVYIIHRIKPNAQLGKGPALQFALDRLKQGFFSNTTIVGVVDADAHFDQNYLYSVWQTFENSDYDLVQTRVKIYNTTLGLTIMQNFEFSIYNALVQLLRTHWGSSLASGNGQFMTLKMAEDVGWSNSLLEDCEFSIRGLLKDYHGTFINTASIEQEGVTHFNKLIRQRTRWCQGGLQCLHKYCSRIITSRTIPSMLKLDILFFLMIPYLSIIIAPAMLISLIILIYYAAFNFWSSFFIILTILIIDYVNNGSIIIKQWRLTKFKFSLTYNEILRTAMIIEFYRLIMAFIPYKAIVRMILGNTSWAKTKHAN